ncbi:DNA polymerase III subunit alpha [Pseudarthrobacter sp. PS3-L1]|uniref:DNA polymerase III subunit alpha n=1 Tax=Pseudarthrobacter sp. PS3-L1 TaxID=3046207 RepID=UPI0024B95448|nr:DNA polymerase III subunit alpha [Pseudarthrobacter sp. PS3-L1]MDJ0320022.1 DNA polymerase III subunit alpha [Pseudarthrobacter sp. PS3-L1]
MSFTHLHVATAFSAHYGVSWPEELAQAASAQGATALACTDRDGLYGTIKHLRACMKEGLDPIVGVDLAVFDADGDLRTQVAGRVVVLAHGHNSGAGYRALCRLISDAHARTSGKAGGAVPIAVTRAELASRVLDPETLNPVLTVLLGPESDVGQAMGARRYLHPRTLYKAWLDAMPPRTLVTEVVTQLSAPGRLFSTSHAVRMLKLAAEHAVPAILTNAVRYASEDGAPTADVLESARTLTSMPELLSSNRSVTPNGQAWLKDPAAMTRLGQEVIAAAGFGAADLTQLLAQTEALADRCRQDPVTDMGWKQPVVPETAILGITQHPQRELEQRCEAGITRRFPGIAGQDQESMRRTLNHELKIIEDLGFSSYFLTVAEVSRMIQDMNVRAAARGSGASSLVNYLIGVSQVNPLEHNLIFERFLSRDRATLPDIDIDVESAERHNVYRKIFDRFGSARVSLMSMQNGYRARGAVRDAGMALGMDDGDVGLIAKQLWRFSARNFREALVEKPELRDFASRVENRDLSENQQLDLLVDLTERLDRLPRHISMHPCGVILGDATLLDRTPVQPSGMGLPMSQFDKHDMDPMGMLKLDVLGVRMQSAMAFAVREVIRLHPSKAEVVAAGKHQPGPDGTGPDYIAENGLIDLNAVPLDDPATFDLIRTTHTLGCFQIESPGQRELIGKLAPRDFNDLIIDISLFRPGPMKSDMVRPFLEHRHGFAPEKYPHPLLRPYLEETHGVTVFHEQILNTLNTMTGCGLATADEYRRLLGSETGEPFVEQKFREGSSINGFSQDVINSVWGTLKAFGSFGFCKAHGAAFAVPTYQSAWLKTHHPEAFLAGIWEHDPGMYPKRLLVAEARRMGIPILPLDINSSAAEYRVERIPDGPYRSRLGIRLSLKGIYGLSGAEVTRIAAGQPYDSLADLRTRSRLSKPSIRRLAQLGAFDSLHRGSGGAANRADLVQHLQALQTAGSSKKGIQVIDGQLAFALGDVELANIKAVLPPPTQVENVRTELDLMAMDVSAHLMDSHRPLLDRIGVVTADKLLGLRNGTDVMVAGVRVATQTPPMRGGRRVVFISLDDGTGCVDTVFFHEAQEQAGPMLFNTRLLLVRGTTRRTGPRGISLSASMAWDLGATDTLPLEQVLPELVPSRQGLDADAGARA